MRSEIVSAIQARLAASNAFAQVCGLHSDKPSYPLVRVWYHGTKENINNEPLTEITSSIGIQIETVLEKDAVGNSVDAPLYDLVDAAFNSLSEFKLPGRGHRQFIVLDQPGLQEFQIDSGPAVYLLTILVRVVPGKFSLT